MKRVVGDEEVKLSRAEEDRLQTDWKNLFAGPRRKDLGSLFADGAGRQLYDGSRPEESSSCGFQSEQASHTLTTSVK